MTLENIAIFVVTFIVYLVGLYMGSRSPRVDKIEVENALLRKALIDCGAHLAGAASAYRTYARRYRNRGPSDSLFDTRIDDFDKAVERVRKILVRYNIGDE